MAYPIAVVTLSLEACGPGSTSRGTRVDSATVWAAPKSSSTISRTGSSFYGQVWVRGDRGEAARAAGRAYGWAYYVIDPLEPGLPKLDSIPEIRREELPSEAAKTVEKRVRELGFSPRCTRIFGPSDGAFQVALHPWCPRRTSHEPGLLAVVGVDGRVHDGLLPALSKNRQWTGTCPIERDSTGLALHLLSPGSTPSC